MSLEVKVSPIMAAKIGTPVLKVDNYMFSHPQVFIVVQRSPNLQPVQVFTAMIYIVANSSFMYAALPSNKPFEFYAELLSVKCLDVLWSVTKWKS